MSSLTMEPIRAKLTFKRLLISTKAPSIRKTNIVVTPEMLELYKQVLSCQVVFITGPPGLGKTTSLYWLYRQLQQLSDIFTVLVPFDVICDDTYKKEVASEIQRCPEGSKLMLLVDLLSPSVDAKEQRKALMQIIVQADCKVVIAQSSSFHLYNVLKSVEVTDWANCVVISKQVKLKPFSDESAKSFLSSLGAKENDIEMMVQYCKGIPKLLCLCGMEDYIARAEQVAQHEFETVIAFMNEHPNRVSWMNEINILMAAKFGISIECVGLTKDVAERLIMCQSYLVNIDEAGIPTPYFPDVHYLPTLVSMLWTNINTSLQMKTDSESVVGIFFECQLPSMMSRAASLTLMVKKLHGRSQAWNITITLTPSSGARLDMVRIPLPSVDVLWRSPKQFKVVDYFIQLSSAPDLPDCPPDMKHRDTVIAMQVTIQQGKRMEKIRKSLVGVSEYLASGRNILFVLLNPLWRDFEANYSTAMDVTSGSAAARFKKSYWYGQPDNLQAYLSLFNTLNKIFT